MMTYSAGRDSAQYFMLDSVVHKINAAFSGPMDTISFGAALTQEGRKIATHTVRIPNTSIWLFIFQATSRTKGVLLFPNDGNGDIRGQSRMAPRPGFEPRTRGSSSAWIFLADDVVVSRRPVLLGMFAASITPKEDRCGVPIPRRPHRQNDRAD